MRPSFRDELLAVPPMLRDAWVDRELGLGEIPDDAGLPSGCVPYLPCSVDVVLRAIDRAGIGPDDVFVDVGGGVGRAAALVHLLTGAGVIALEIQPQLAAMARELAARLQAPRIACVEGDALELAGYLVIGTVFFFYCPFSGRRLAKVLADLEPIARTRTIRVCCVDVPLPSCDWLVREPVSDDELAVYRSVARRDSLVE